MANIQYKKLRRQYSTNNGITWSDLQPMTYKVGDLISNNSYCVARIYREINADPSVSFDCDENGNKYTMRLWQYSDNDGLTWITYKQERGVLNESLSEDCGVVNRWQVLDIDQYYYCEEAIDGREDILDYYYDYDGVIGVVYKQVDIDTFTSYTFKSIPRYISSFPSTVNFTSMYKLFAYNHLIYVNLDNVNTSNVTNMSYMFASGSSLTSLNVSKFDTSKVTTMKSMFQGCSKLTTLDLSSFDTSNVTTMESMFSGCSSLEVLDISGWVLGSKTMGNWIYKCDNLKTIIMRGCNEATIQYIQNYLNTYNYNNVEIITD